MLSKIELMAMSAERVAEAANALAKRSAEVSKKAATVAREIRDNNSFSFTNLGWFIPKMDMEAVELQEREFERLWREYRDELSAAKCDTKA